MLSERLREYFKAGHLVNLGYKEIATVCREDEHIPGLASCFVRYPLLVPPSHLMSLNGREESQAWQRKRVIPLAAYCQWGSQSILFAGDAGIT